MELQSKSLYSGVLDELLKIRQSCELNTDKTKELKDAVETMPLLVPVVGEFSAGKSSMLNTLIGKNILGVAMDPKTAIPSELYYSETEYNEGVYSDGRSEQVNDVNQIKDYVKLRRYVNSEFLKKIQPIVLVDMPGFDSPLDEHNKAIYSYLEFGIHYAVLVPSDAGTISRSMKQQVENILSFNKTCSFFVSKTDLRSEEEVQQIKEELGKELSILVADSVELHGLNREDVSVFDKFVSALDANDLIKKQFKEKILDDCYDLKSSINMKISALSNDSKKNQNAVKELQEAILKIEDEKQKMIERSKRDTYAEEADSIASAVGSALNSNLDTLVNCAINGGDNSLNDEIQSIVQNIVVSKIQKILGDVSSRYSIELSKKITNLNQVFESYNNQGTLSRIQQSIRSAYDSSKTAVDAYIKERQENKDASTAYKAITGILAATTTVLNPILEVIIIMLPDLINLIFGSSKEKKQQEEVRNKIQAQIPSIKREVRNKVVEELQKNGAEMVNTICARFDEELQKRKAELEEVEKKGLQDKEKIEETISFLQSQKTAVEDLLEKVTA